MSKKLPLSKTREARDQARIIALREAARVGIADIEAGRFEIFENPAAIKRHIKLITNKAIKKTKS